VSGLTLDTADFLFSALPPVGPKAAERPRFRSSAIQPIGRGVQWHIDGSPEIGQLVADSTRSESSRRTTRPSCSARRRVSVSTLRKHSVEPVVEFLVVPLGSAKLHQKRGQRSTSPTSWWEVGPTALNAESRRR
jgi:hypothetical protein